MAEESQIRSFYAGKNFFITGGTGFVGLCLIEKILRSLPDAGKLYLLMRPKKGKEIATRLEEFPKNLIFETLLQSTTADVFKRLVPVAGDVGEENLGLSPEDRQLLIDNVHVVIHSAATLDFEQNLKPTVRINVLGTRRVLELSAQMRGLKAMVHISSAYVNSNLHEAREKLYSATEDVEKVITLVGTLSDEALENVEPKLLKNHPNSYTFTKHLAEHEVNKHSDKLPCAIVRPSMIVAAWKEPVPGWTCSKVGPQGFLMGASKGVVRRLPLVIKNIADYIPVDVVVNELLVAGFQASKSSNGLAIYHCTSSTQKPFRWEMMKDTINKELHRYPLKNAVWYPHLAFVNSLLLFKISAIFVHFIPAIFLDMLLRITGGRPMLVRLHKNVWNSLNRLETFIFTEWKFHNTNTIELAGQMNSTDSKLFYIDISDIDWRAYFVVLLLGVRRYLNGEKESSLPAARRKDTVLFIAHIIWQVLIISVFWYLVACLIELTMIQSAYCVLVLYILYSVL